MRKTGKNMKIVCGYKQCCFCVDHKDGVAFYAGFNACLTIFIIVTEATQGTLYLPFVIMYGIIIASSLLLIIGTHAGKPLFVLAWIIINFTCTITISSICLHFIVIDKKDAVPWQIHFLIRKYNNYSYSSLYKIICII